MADSNPPTQWSSDRPHTLELVRPSYEDNEVLSAGEGEGRSAEAAPRFKAFEGSGRALLTPGQVKGATPSQMHRLALVRLARMRGLGGAEAEAEAAKQSAEAAAEDAAAREQEPTAEEIRMLASHLAAAAPVASGATSSATPAVAAAAAATARVLHEEAEGEQKGTDEGGGVWWETWSVDAATGLRQGHKWGRDAGGSRWWEDWQEVQHGQFSLDGHNEQGHRWGEEWGTLANGTTFQSKYLEKTQEGYIERSGSNSAGQTSGLRRGRAEDGTWWLEEWVQTEVAPGHISGSLKGSNEHGESWTEMWETTPLNAFDAETGRQKTSSFGQKAGTDRQGKKWSESWGVDEIFGKWGTRSEISADGSEWTEDWGENLEGDVWCAKWGKSKKALGVTDEWGFKCGKKKLRIGQEMDGRVNLEEGKIETWTETWCKTFEADGRMARSHAEKEGDNGFGDKWVEKWDELYSRDGSTEKWASKTGRKEATVDEWKEEWFEKRAAPDEHNPSGRFLGCWAEKRGTNGFGEEWYDKWSEQYEAFGMGGSKVCNKWRRLANGSEQVERSGEEWDGKGWFQKGGESLLDGNKVSGWHERAW